MAREVSKAPSSATRPPTTRRRRRPARALSTTGQLSPSPVPQQREAPEAETISTRPRLNWVLAPDATGRMRPEARWR
ncbi:hypothetical protein [Actinorugispora endophytica]|uniref:Uncharacterized protein n=1 Tax=Actinorugispora endophytica TaxID=1605990 RepID=A0A4R6V8L8_9ACTN|nr:hypothetical protein [Actinorugispora endophytica]TDQ55499.1 hypothetical protein EV190_101830 [Actinorugispora endophytica]